MLIGKALGGLGISGVALFALGFFAVPGGDLEGIDGRARRSNLAPLQSPELAR
jgi:hypothetical protein